MVGRTTEVQSYQRVDFAKEWVAWYRWTVRGPTSLSASGNWRRWWSWGKRWAQQRGDWRRIWLVQPIDTDKRYILLLCKQGSQGNSTRWIDLLLLRQQDQQIFAFKLWILLPRQPLRLIWVSNEAWHLYWRDLSSRARWSWMAHSSSPGCAP